ncbi:DSCR3 (predicted) [Pycnogonum litorale]
MVERCDSPIKSIELQLIRIESCLGNDDYTREATEIQNVQLVEGDLCRGLSVPIYLIFPRIITCPTLISTYFKIEFELSIILIFDDGQSVSENFPIKLTRF